MALAATPVAVILVASSGDGGETDSAAPGTSGDSTAPPSDDPTTTTLGDDTDESNAPCGVTLAEVQALLPTDSRITENATPDPGRFNFTWDDRGPRGIDVAIVTGGRTAFEVPAAYVSLDGYGDEAFEATGGGRASAVAFVGDDLYAADVVADGAGVTDDELRTLCLQVLELALT